MVHHKFKVSRFTIHVSRFTIHYSRSLPYSNHIFNVFLPWPYLLLIWGVHICIKQLDMKNVLIPTDLTVQSLWPIHKLVNDANGETLNIYLVHVLYMPTDFHELIGIRKANPRELASANFLEAYEILRNKNKSVINMLHLDFIYGSNKRILANYMEGKAIDEIYQLTNFNYNFDLLQSVDFIPYLKQGQIPVIQMPFHIEKLSDYQTLSTLLTGKTGLREILNIERKPVFATLIEN